MRSAVLLIVLASACLAPAAEPREDFLRIDQPLALGYARVQERLEAVRALRPTVGLHLSGGSARGFAHLGVLKRLEEEGLYPDVIVTTSMGSVIGLLYAAGVPLDVIEELFQYIDFGELFTLKLPTGGGLADLRGMSALLQALVGEVDVAELPIPVVAVCEDLVSMRRVLVAEGPFGEVLRAAIAIPALFEPVELEGLTLIDGGITNLAALEPFAGLNEAVIAATAFYNRDLEPKDPFTVITMAVNIGKSRTAVEDIRRFQPLLIRTDVEEFSFMGWNQLAQIQDRGYASCSERIGDLRAYLERTGVPLPLPDPRGATPERYRRRWRDIKGRLEAGQRLPLPRGFGALQAHALVLRRYRGSNRLVQANYAAASFLYEKGSSGLRLGLLSDLGSRHGAFLDLDTAPGALRLELENYLFFTLEDALLRDPASYHLLRVSLEPAVAGWLSGGPFLLGELLVPLQGGEPLVRAAGGLRARARGPGTRAGAQLDGFWASPSTTGLEAELYLRQRLAGPLHAFGRALLHACGQGTEAPGYNDFYRGILPSAPLSSFAVFNTELIVAPASLALPLWESVIFRDLELSAFGDLFWEEAADLSADLALSLGVSLQGEAGLWGLLPLRAMLSAGYDMGKRRAFVSLNLGRPF
jgi:predicted acylesterase/phospholipase RssA